MGASSSKATDDMVSAETTDNAADNVAEKPSDTVVDPAVDPAVGNKVEDADDAVKVDEVKDDQS